MRVEVVVDAREVAEGVEELRLAVEDGQHAAEAGAVQHVFGAHLGHAFVVLGLVHFGPG